MNIEEMKTLIDSMRGKLSDTDSAKLSEDFLGIIGAYQGVLDENAGLKTTNDNLKQENDEILKVNGQLFQRIGSQKGETTETKILENEDKNTEIPAEEKVTINDLINEKGEWL